MNDDAAGQGPHERPVVPLLARLRAMEDLRRLEGDQDEAELCREVAEELHNLAWALSLPGFDRMATDEQEAEHQAGVQRVNDVLAEMERRKAEHDAAMADAARFRWLDEVALSVDMVADPDNLVQVWHETLSGHATTGRTLREAVDEAMKRHNAAGKAPAAPADAETLRNMSTYVSTYAPDRPSTPVGWSDTDWIKHLDEIRQNEAAYARGPLPERGWD